jgi:hypothetical protein
MTLIKVIQCSKGDVVEVGVGPFSTPILHWLCKEYKRNLISYEDDKEYYDFAKQFQSQTHRIRLVSDWKKLDYETKRGVIFIDNHPSMTRAEIAIRFKDTADYIVMHDTEPDHDKEYNWERVWNVFKYQYHWTECRPWTSVVSNFKKLKSLK